MTNIIDANNATATLATAIIATSTTISLSNLVNWPTITGTQVIRATIYTATTREIIDIDPSGNITRAREGTTALPFPTGAGLEIRPTAGKLAEKQNRIANPSDVIDFGDATSLEVPNNTSPTLNANGQIALDNTVTDYTGGILCYRSGGTNYGLIAVPLADLVSPTDTYVISYDATTDKFKLVAQSGGGGGGVTSATGTANQISVSASTGAVTFSIANNPVIPGTSGMVLPQGTTIGNATAGKIRYNTTRGEIEVDTGSAFYSYFRMVSGTTNGSRYIPVFSQTNSMIMIPSSAWVDTSGNVVAPGYTPGYTTTATSAGTTTLTVASNMLQYFTGTTTHTLKLPVTSTLPQTGYSITVVNNSTGVVTVQSSGSNTILAMPASTIATFTCILTSGTTAASWDYYTNAKVGTPNNTFSTISIAGQSDVVADNSSDTLTLVAGTNVTMTTNAATDTITINASGGGGSSDWVLISTATASSSASVAFTGLSSTYQAYMVIMTNVLPATNAVELWARTSTNNGVSYDSGASNYQYTNFGAGATPFGGRNTAATQISLMASSIFGTLSNSAVNAISYNFMLFDPSASAGYPRCVFHGHDSFAPAYIAGTGCRLSTTAVNAIQFLMSSGNIASGTFKLYGMKA